MSKTIPFFDLFSDYIPERELRILLLEVLIEEAAGKRAGKGTGTNVSAVSAEIS